MAESILKIIMLGDIIGKTGRDLFARHKERLLTDYSADAIIINGENSADCGKGITPAVADFFKEQGVSLITTGNHIWDDETIIPYMKQHTFVLRPANLSSECPGVGIAFFSCKGYTVGVMNLMGRVFMQPFSSCPLATAERLLKESAPVTPIMLVDFHAAATAEKLGLGLFLEGKVTAVVGTHTHTQTNDARILPGGTAYMTDLGMSGSLHSVVGFKVPATIEKFNTGMRTDKDRGVATHPPYLVAGAVITIDALTGKALAIERIAHSDHEPLYQGISS